MFPVDIRLISSVCVYEASVRVFKMCYWAIIINVHLDTVCGLFTLFLLLSVCWSGIYTPFAADLVYTTMGNCQIFSTNLIVNGYKLYIKVRWVFFILYWPSAFM